ncbi:MAG TPA: DUF2846 domain-containing protein [Caulobacteraceae bacterium]
MTRGRALAPRTRRDFLVAVGGGAAIATFAFETFAGAPVLIGDPPPEKALIVFYRTWKYPAAALSYAVREGQTKLGILAPGSYFVVSVDPGLHTYAVRSERSDAMQIVVEAGEVYYVRFELETGWLLYQPTLTPSEQRLFDTSSGRLRLSEPLADTNAATAAPLGSPAKTAP